MKRLAALQDWPVLSSFGRRLRGPVEVVGAEQDERVRAAELEHYLLQVAAGDLGDGGAGALGAGDRDAAHPGVGDHPLDLLVGRVDVLVGAFGKAGVIEDLLHRLGRFGALRRVLEQDRVADHQVRSGEAGDLVVGEVPGHDPEQDPEGAAANHRRALAAEQLDRLVGHQVLGVVGIEAVDFRREVDLHQRLLDRLAHLADDDLGQLSTALGVQLADLAHQRGALRHRGGTGPGSGGLVGPADRGAELVVADLRVLPDRLAGGWVDYRVSAHSALPWMLAFKFVLPLQGSFQPQAPPRPPRTPNPLPPPPPGG
jgi:hypothetical protein